MLYNCQIMQLSKIWGYIALLLLVVFSQGSRNLLPAASCVVTEIEITGSLTFGLLVKKTLFWPPLQGAWCQRMLVWSQGCFFSLAGDWLTWRIVGVFWQRKEHETVTHLDVNLCRLSQEGKRGIPVVSRNWASGGRSLTLIPEVKKQALVSHFTNHFGKNQLFMIILISRETVISWYHKNYAIGTGYAIVLLIGLSLWTSISYLTLSLSSKRNL